MLASTLIAAGIALALIGALLALVDTVLDKSGAPLIHRSRWPFLALATIGVGMAALPFWL